MWSIRFTNEAICELDNTIENYEGLIGGLGDEFRFEKQIQLLMQNPYTHAIRYLNIRFVLLERFPYAIHYTIKENIIIIYTVLSTFKDPEVN